MLLLSSHHISTLIMRNARELVFHAGSERTLSESCRWYCIVRGRRLAKKLVRDCTTCRKLRQPPNRTLMADLPPEGMKPFPAPSLVTGVDLFGPFKLKYRRNKPIKAWGTPFACATVREVQLEIVQDLSTPFLKHFAVLVSHYAWPSTFISDNGKSFVGTEKELRKSFVEGIKAISDFAVLHKIQCKFTIPHSPYQGGL